jgi:hypothetical protein
VIGLGAGEPGLPPGAHGGPAHPPADARRPELQRAEPRPACLLPRRRRLAGLPPLRGPLPAPAGAWRCARARRVRRAAAPSPAAGQPAAARLRARRGAARVSQGAFLGHRLLQEYFAFPEKYLFVELRNLTAALLDEPRAHARGAGLPRRAAARPRGQAGAAEPQAGLHAGGEPLRADGRADPADPPGSEYPVIPDTRAAAAYEVHSITAVESFDASSGKSRVFHPCTRRDTGTRRPTRPSGRPRCGRTTARTPATTTYLTLVDRARPPPGRDADQDPLGRDPLHQRRPAVRPADGRSARRLPGRGPAGRGAHPGPAQAHPHAAPAGAAPRPVAADQPAEHQPRLAGRAAGPPTAGLVRSGRPARAARPARLQRHRGRPAADQPGWSASGAHRAAPRQRRPDRPLRPRHRDQPAPGREPLRRQRRLPAGRRARALPGLPGPDQRLHPAGRRAACSGRRCSSDGRHAPDSGHLSR